MISKYRQLKIQIDKKVLSLQQDISILKKICPHNEIELKSYCDDEDEYFTSRTYEYRYHCHFCGECAYSRNKETRELFDKLQEKFNKQERKKSSMWKDRDY